MILNLIMAYSGMLIYSKPKQTDEKIDGPVSMSEVGKEGVADVDNERTE